MTKPPYRIPSMAEISAVPRNGLTVASTFSGCGGSCLGFRWAGFEHVYANEFTPIARASYSANFPEVNLDGRDIRDVTAAEILIDAGLAVGELDILEGSPPCQAFSTAGKRAAGWGKVKDQGKNREDLFFEYIRLLRGLMPRAFVAENVSGLIKGVAKGYFVEIMREMRASGYRVECRVLDAQWLGVPQARQRTIFVGFREDLRIAPAFPAPLPYRYSIRDALAGVASVEFRTGARKGNWNPYNKKFDVDVDVINTIRKTADGVSLTEGWLVTDLGLFVEEITLADMDLVHISGRKAATMAGFGNKPAPTLMARGIAANWKESVLISSNGGPRKLTIAELRRLGGFPDDFQLVGSYADQWARIGNSVPPPMAMRVASAIRDALLQAKKS